MVLLYMNLQTVDFFCTYHNKCIIQQKCIIGEGNVIFAEVSIGENSIIKMGNKIYSNVGKKSKIGDNNIISKNCQLGDLVVIKDKNLINEGCFMGDNSQIASNHILPNNFNLKKSEKFSKKMVSNCK